MEKEFLAKQKAEEDELRRQEGEERLKEIEK
jgi:hypothetical protein